MGGLVMKRATILSAVLTMMLLSGCAEWETYTPSAIDLTRIVEEIPPGPTRDMIQATAVQRYVEAEMLRQQAAQAQATADAARIQHEQRVAQMTAEAQAYERARASAAEATRQALDAQERQNAINATATAQAALAQAEATRQAGYARATATAEVAHVTATAQAWAVQATATEEARRATATAQSERATATARAYSIQTTATTESQIATATVVARQDAASATAVQATAAAVARLDRREALLEPVRAVGVLLVILCGIGGVGYLGLRIWNLIEDRGRVIRRQPDEGEPIVVLDRERIALPMRQFGSYADMTRGSERAPMLAPSPELQERATARQQTVNLEHASQTGDVVKARHQPKKEKVRNVIFPGGVPLPPPRMRGRPEQGLRGVRTIGALDQAAADGVLPPQLAQAIEGQWEEMGDE
jgi:chemotaxis protein histidine kinase CheA